MASPVKSNSVQQVDKSTWNTENTIDTKLKPFCVCVCGGVIHYKYCDSLEEPILKSSVCETSLRSCTSDKVQRSFISPWLSKQHLLNTTLTRPSCQTLPPGVPKNICHLDRSVIFFPVRTAQLHKWEWCSCHSTTWYYRWAIVRRSAGTHAHIYRSVLWWKRQWISEYPQTAAAQLAWVAPKMLRGLCLSTSAEDIALKL